MLDECWRQSWSQTAKPAHWWFSQKPGIGWDHFPPAEEHHCCLSSIKFYCLMTEAYWCVWINCQLQVEPIISDCISDRDSVHLESRDENSQLKFTPLFAQSERLYWYVRNSSKSHHIMSLMTSNHRIFNTFDDSTFSG